MIYCYRYIHDDYRIEYLCKHIQAAIEAVDKDGVDLISYTPWGIIDIVSFTTGEMKKTLWINSFRL